MNEHGGLRNHKFLELVKKINHKFFSHKLHASNYTCSLLVLKLFKTAAAAFVLKSHVIEFELPAGISIQNNEFLMCFKRESEISWKCLNSLSRQTSW
jgi:hypothetical protein